MPSIAGMANRQEDVDLRETQVSAHQLTLWLALERDSFLARIFNAVLRTHHVPQTWKYARVISILKRGKDPALPYSHRSLSLLDRNG